jgi:phospholipid transport system substrate-binding protein
MKATLDRLYQFVMMAMALLAVVVLFSAQAAAQEAPDALVKRISQEVLNAAKNDKDLQAGNVHLVRALVESKIFPHIDFPKTTDMVAGRFWRDATPEQQTQFIVEFRNLLIHTYAGALAQVNDQKLEFRPSHADSADTEVKVHS